MESKSATVVFCGRLPTEVDQVGPSPRRTEQSNWADLTDFGQAMGPPGEAMDLSVHSAHGGGARLSPYYQITIVVPA
ncbi:hypothetical protein THAOC_00795 [Thalassiosira oceanica]|uniref:Uncharacterized protein n=1 Tax=Thalassiosira oceanica TaxID=159749 RepID=K0TR89_THAOC|nr:hypothetical protein THAOC_00795 [Thalassiosira oceanica]|eukprot:EJK77377.1 hypothetical protein THAOC_00795 [Thalassiosira oceanica]